MYFIFLYAYICAYHTLSISFHLISYHHHARENSAVKENVASLLDNLHNILSLYTLIYIYSRIISTTNYHE